MLDRRQFPLLLTASILLPLLFVCVVSWQQYEQVLESGERQNEAYAELLEERVGGLMREQALTLELVAREIDGLSWDEIARSAAVTDVLRQRAAPFGPDASVWLVDPNGIQVNSARLGQRRIDVSEREYISAAPLRGMFVSKAFVGRFRGSVQFSVSMRRLDAQGRPDGHLVMNVGAEHLTAALRQLIGPESSKSFSLMRDDGEMLVRSPNLEQPVRLAPDAGIMRWKQIKPDAGSFVTVAQVDGVKRLYSYRRVQGYPLYVSFGTSLADLVQPWYGMLGFNLAVGLAVSMVLVLLVLLAMHRVHLDRLMTVELEEAVRLRSAEAEHRAAEAEAARTAADRANHAKDHFLAAASHDLRQPLQGLRLYLEVLRNQTSGGLAQKAVQQAFVALEGAEGLLAGLLDMSRLDAGVSPVEITSFPAQGLLDALAGELAPMAAEKGLRLQVPATGAWVSSDRMLLHRALRNLVVNAVRYTERGGIVIGARRRGDRVRFEVWDSGLGIPADKQELIFEEFYQIDNQARDRSLGLGLGLSIVRRVGRMLGHPVSLRSVPGRGSVFAIEVPAAAEEILPAAGAIAV